MASVAGRAAPASYYERREVNQPAIAQVAGNVYAFSYEAERSPTGATPWERIGKVSTITIANGVITPTPIDTLTFETVHCAWPRLRRIAGDVFLVAYDGLVSSTLTTIRISDSGEIGDQPINTLRSSPLPLAVRPSRPEAASKPSAAITLTPITPITEASATRWTTARQWPIRIRQTPTATASVTPATRRSDAMTSLARQVLTKAKKIPSAFDLQKPREFSTIQK
jgi:hypothetical protein